MRWMNESHVTNQTTNHQVGLTKGPFIHMYLTAQKRIIHNMWKSNSVKLWQFHNGCVWLMMGSIWSFIAGHDLWSKSHLVPCILWSWEPNGFVKRSVSMINTKKYQSQWLRRRNKAHWYSYHKLLIMFS